MSAIYATEPPPRGRVVLATSFGELDIELFSREAPRACRNFVQLCLDGYYDGVAFHRLLPGLMLQGGDPTGTGGGGDSAVDGGAPFPNECHSRLKFTRRGLVGCAGGAGAGGDRNTSQFFMTYAPARHLDGAHTIFGRLAGDTVFNLMSTEEVAVDEQTDRPEVALTILGATVPENPFEDGRGAITAQPGRWPHQVRAIEAERARKAEAAKPKAPRKKQLNLLSFGDDAEEDEEELDELGGGGVASSHDVLADKRLLKGAAGGPAAGPGPSRAPAAATGAGAAADGASMGPPGAAARPPAGGGDGGGEGKGDGKGDGNDDDDDAFNRRMMKKVLEQKQRLAAAAAAAAAGAGGEDHGERRQRDQQLQAPAPAASQQPAADAVRRQTARAAPLPATIGGVKVRGGKLALKGLKGRGGVAKRRGGDESDTLARMQRFKAAMAGAADGGGGGNGGGAGGGDDGDGWRSHRLEVESGPNPLDAMARHESADDYVVVDPLVEKGKQKFMDKQRRKGGGGWGRGGGGLSGGAS